MKRIILLSLIISLSYFTRIFAEQWQFCNGPYGGYTWNLVYDKDSKNLFANSYYIYKYDEEKNRWNIFNHQQDSIYYYTIFVAGDIYLLNYMDRGDVISNVGIYRSLDKGVTWEESNWSHYDIRDIIYIDSSNIIASCGFGDGIIKSTDKGLSWFDSNSGIDSSALKHGDGFDNLEIAKTDSGDYIFVGLYDHGVYRSSNNGESWQMKNSELTDSSCTALTITKDNIIYSATKEKGIFRSTDLGESWEKYDKGIDSLYLNVYSLTSDKDGNVYANMYYYGAARMDAKNGVWKLINNSLIPNTIWNILYIEDKDELYAATAAGVYKSTNHGDNWFDFSNGIDLTTGMKCIAIDNVGGIFAGSEDNGIYYSSDKGKSWILKNNGIEKCDINTIKVKPDGTVFAYSNEERIYKSTNNGDNWFQVFSGSPNWYPNVRDAIGFNSKGDIFATLEENGIIHSSDDGVSWKNIGFTNEYIKALVIDKNDNIFVGHDSSIYRSSDNGISWIEVFKYDDWLSINSYLVTIDNTIFAGTFDDFIFRSTDGGLSWEQLKNGLTDKASFTCFEYSEKIHTIYCGTSYDGYFVSSDNGDTWSNYFLHGKIDNKKDNPQLIPAPRVFRDLVIDNNNFLYAATHNGVYKLDLATQVDDKNIESLKFNVFPNPVQDKLYIQMSLKEKSSYLLKIVNELGITIWENSGYGKGQLEMEINTNHFANGVYFCQLINKENNFITKPIIVIK